MPLHLRSGFSGGGRLCLWLKNKCMDNFLTGSKVRLRALEPGDVELLYAWENDPRVWSVSGTLAPFSRETLRQFIDNQRLDIFHTRQLRFVICRLEEFGAKPGVGNFAAVGNLAAGAGCGGEVRNLTAKNHIANRDNTVDSLGGGAGVPIGFIDLFDFEPVHLRAGVGILICDEADRRQGYAAEALELLTLYASTVLGLHQLYAGVEADNARSIGLFRGAGFSQIGVRRDWIRRRGGRYLNNHLAYVDSDDDRTGNGEARVFFDGSFDEVSRDSWCDEIEFQKILP